MQQPPPPPPPAPPPAPFPNYGQPQPAGVMQPYGYTQPFGYAPPQRSRRRWWLYGCGGCAAIVVVLVAIAAVIGIIVFTNSPLRHFPTEAGATTVRDNFQVVNGHSDETLVIDDPHPLADVETFYQAALHTGGWTADTADPAQALSGDMWHFSRTGSPSQSGLVTFVAISGTTQVTVTYDN